MKSKILLLKINVCSCVFKRCAFDQDRMPEGITTNIMDAACGMEIFGQND